MSNANNDNFIWRRIAERASEHTIVLHDIKRVIFSGSTKYQEVDIVETFDYGLCLFLDGKLQSSEKDEYVYHESLVHPAMVTHPKPEKVLIIGGGEGATLREVLKHNTVKEAIMVDIDREVIELCKKYLVNFHKGAFDDPRARVIISDGREYLKNKNEEYDVIVVDVTDPLKGGPSYLLYTKEFYELAYRALKEDGVMVTQATSTFYTLDAFAIIYNTIKSVFPIARPYQIWVHSFNSLWGFVVGSKRHDPLSLEAEDVDKILKNRGVESGLRFYEGVIHKMIFVLPKELREALKRESRIATDREPVFVV